MAIHPIILAAGPAPHLGFPKALARFGERTALQIALDNVAGLSQPVVVLGSQADEILRGASIQGRVVVNRRWQDGQLSSLLAGLAVLPPAADFMLYPVDYPLLARELIATLVDHYSRREPSQSIAFPIFRGRAGHPVIFAAALRDELQRAQTAREVVYREQARLKIVEAGAADIWQDIDTPSAYAARLREFNRRAGLVAAGAER